MEVYGDTVFRLTKKLKPEMVPAIRKLKPEAPVKVKGKRKLKPEAPVKVKGKRKLKGEKPAPTTVSAAERAFENQDIMAQILGMRRNLQRSESWAIPMRKVMDEYYFEESYDDGEHISAYTTAGPLLEQLRAGKLKATVSIPYGSMYGGNGSGNGNSIDMFRECLNTTKHAFTVTEKEDALTLEDFQQLHYYEYYLEGREERSESDDEEELEDPFDYSGVVHFTLKCKDENQRKEAIEWLEMFQKVAEQKEVDTEQEDLVKHIDRDIDNFLRLRIKLTKALPTSEIHKKDEYKERYAELKKQIEHDIQNVRNDKVRKDLMKKFANE